MGDKKNTNSPKDPEERREVAVKRCPDCFVNLPIDAKRCFSCNARVGGVDKHGKAKPAVDWVAYIICILSWTIFFVYIKWAFKL